MIQYINRRKRIKSYETQFGMHCYCIEVLMSYKCLGRTGTVWHNIFGYHIDCQLSDEENIQLCLEAYQEHRDKKILEKRIKKIVAE